MKNFLLSLILIPTLSLASLNEGGGGGDRVGNGGDIVMCTFLSGEVIYVLEEFEAIKPISIGKKGQSYREKVFFLIEKMKDSFPQRYTFYLKNFAYFEKNVTFLKASLPEIDDARETIGYSCEITQTAYFKKDRNGNNNYYIQKHLWDLLNEDQKAILVMHELLYTEAVGLGHQTSFYIRKINIELFSKGQINPKLIDEQFLKPILKNGLPDRIGLILEQIYSKEIAVYILNQNLSYYYFEQGFKDGLIRLMKRFDKDPTISKLIKEHLQNL